MNNKQMMKNSFSPTSLHNDIALFRSKIGHLLYLRMREEFADFDEPIDPSMTFDYLGISSLARVELVTSIEKEFGIHINIHAAFEFTTLNALTEYVWEEHQKEHAR